MKEKNTVTKLSYTMVTEVETGEGAEERLNFLPMPCQHCGDAPCVKACPTGALYKREDGIVLSDRERCVGCHECLWACPFGIPQFGRDGLMQKCTMCYNRIDEGGLPACAANCPAEAILCDTVENVSRIIRERYAKDANKMGGLVETEAFGVLPAEADSPEGRP